jgi:hypothetical protein
MVHITCYNVQRTMTVLYTMVKIRLLPSGYYSLHPTADSTLLVAY